ncbi:VEFS-Box of polycomb protein [Rhizophagus diaphanus]|nr:VEFS-Box of polycomb protein [Rhizophagus diaphanus] [Rhizophagus sp. MUCL 43196]
MVNRAIKSIVDQNRVSSLFRETFTGPSCLYHWLNSYRPRNYLRRNLSYIQKSRRKTIKNKPKQQEQRLTLEDLCRRRKQEEETISTSRIHRTLQLTFQGLVAYASHSPGNRSRINIECEITVFEVKKSSSNIAKKRKLNNGKFESNDFQLTHRSTIPLVLDENGCSMGNTLSIEPYTTNINGVTSQDVILGFRLYALNSQSWPPVSAESVRTLINGEKRKLHLIPKLVDCSDGRRILCVQMGVIENGNFCKDRRYELDLSFAREQCSIIESNWKMRFTVNWKHKVNLPLKPMSSRPSISVTAPSDDPLVTYVYRVADCELHQAMKGFRCPWCTNLSFRDSTCLMFHLRNNHMHLKFNTKNGKQAPSDRIIVVSSNDDLSELDFFDIDKREGTWNPKPFVYPVKQYTTPPVALSSMPSLTFYNSQTFMPYHVDDDVDDSEDDICTHWVQQYNDETLDEIPDVNDKEKLMMKMWNRFIEPQKGLADRNLPEVCFQFSKARADQIISLDLRNEFAFHLLNILEFQLIDSQCVSKCLGYVDKVKNNNKKNL